MLNDMFEGLKKKTQQVGQILSNFIEYEKSSMAQYRTTVLKHTYNAIPTSLDKFMPLSVNFIQKNRKYVNFM